VAAFHHLSTDAILDQLGTAREGLSEQEAATRLERHGALVQRAAGSWDGWPGCGRAVTVSGMPFKYNAARRHRIPKTRYRVQNWPAYKAGLKRRGDLTLWLDEAALAQWQTPRRTTPGGQARYSDAAIEVVLRGNVSV
jgi:DDE family transposase/cation transport ATPase-like protein